MLFNKAILPIGNRILNSALKFLWNKWMLKTSSAMNSLTRCRAHRTTHHCNSPCRCCFSGSSWTVDPTTEHREHGSEEGQGLLYCARFGKVTTCQNRLCLCTKYLHRNALFGSLNHSWNQGYFSTKAIPPPSPSRIPVHRMVPRSHHGQWRLKE